MGAKRGKNLRNLLARRMTARSGRGQFIEWQSMADWIACSCGLTVRIGPANPDPKQVLRRRPRRQNLADRRRWIRAIDFGSKRASRLRVVMLRKVRSAEGNLARRYRHYRADARSLNVFRRASLRSSLFGANGQALFGSGAG